MKIERTGALLLAMIACASPTLAQSNVSPVQRFAWAEGAGWLNWRHDTPTTDDGVIVNASYLEGSVWGENLGWIHLGDGTPNAQNGGLSCYANVDGTDYGVNRDPNSGELSGFAWSENGGWINFAGGALATPPNPARVDGLCRLRGYAWGENLGWINLDDALHYVALLLDGDTDSDGDIDLTDLAVLLAHFDLPEGATRADGDADGDGDVDLTDLAVLLANFDVTCS